MITPLRNIIAGSALAFATVASASVLDEWTFTSGTPQVSDIQGRTMGNWDPALAGTSVPSAGLLRDATGGNSTGAFYGDNLGVAESFDSLTLTVDVADINFAERDYWFDFGGTTGGNMRGEINASSGGLIFFDVEGGGTALKNVATGYGSVFDVAEYTGAISMQVAFTWDFANNTLSYTVSGDGVGYTGAGSSAFSDTQTVAADLSGITNIRSMRVQGNTVGAGEYIDLDNVRIEYTTPPPPAVLVLDKWTFTDAVAPQNSDIGNDTIDFWDPALAGNSHDVGAGVLTWGYVPPEGGFKTSSSAFLGSTWLGAPGGTIPQLVLTIDAKNISFVENSSYGWQFTGPTGAIATGFVRARIAYFNGNVTMRMEGTDAEFNGGTLYNQADYTSITDLQLTFTWDFVNNTMSTVATGSGELAAGGTGTISLSNSVAQDLSGVTNLAAFRTRAQGTGGSFMQLDTVSIGYATPPTPPSITGFSVSGGVATIDFTSDNASDSAVDFTLLSSETLGGFTADPAANPVSGSEGNFQVTVPFVGPKRFYKVEK